MNQLRKLDSYRDSIGRSVDSCSSEFGERLQRRRVVSAMLDEKIEYLSKWATRWDSKRLVSSSIVDIDNRNSFFSRTKNTIFLTELAISIFELPLSFFSSYISFRSSVDP